MSLKKAYLTALRVGGGLLALSMTAGPAAATDYTVKTDGTGAFVTIQACANAVTAGDTCVVSAGVYNEHVRTAAGGSEAARVTFRAQGAVTMQGFDIQHPYVTVQGFNITGFTQRYGGFVTIYAGGSNCEIANNVIRDGVADVTGIYFYATGGQAANDCVVRGNRLSNLRYTFVVTVGDGHLFESNTLDNQNGMDYVRLFGSNIVFRRNVFWRGPAVASTGNHPDFVQTFGSPDFKSENHLFEENWIQDLDSQFSQQNSGDGVTSKGILYSNVKNITFRRNIVINVSNNANIGMPGVRFENNTFYRLATTQSGIGYGGSLTRGDSSAGVLKNNVFLEGGFRSTGVGDSGGYYWNSGGVFSKEVLAVFVTNDPTLSGSLTVAIFNDLVSKGYINTNGGILAPAKALSSLTQFQMDGQYSTYRSAVYDLLTRTVRMDAAMRSTFSADYNYVAGAASAGFPAKRGNACDSGATYTDFNFCEPHGINGGDPRLTSLANVLGPDGIPFTLDDGLRPAPTSPLCGRGEGGVDIGAYSCTAGQVFSGTASSGPSTVTSGPTNLRIVP
jgi:hypothetical protein